MVKIKIFSGLLLVFVFISAAIPSRSYFAKVTTLEIKGYVFEDDEKIDGALVKLYQNNKMVRMMKTKKSKFQFVLFSGERYMVEVVKAGSFTERIQFSTIEKTEFEGKYSYEFRVDLVKEIEFEGVDVSNLDYPTAIISYDKEEGEYLYDREYSRQVKADLKKMKIEIKNK
jgi:hypothetical protein